MEAQKKIKEVDRIIEEEYSISMKRIPSEYLFDVWSTKKALLKKMYNIDWQSPRDLNPNMHWD